MPSWHGAQLNKAKGQFYLLLLYLVKEHLLFPFKFPTFVYFVVILRILF